MQHVCFCSHFSWSDELKDLRPFPSTKRSVSQICPDLCWGARLFCPAPPAPHSGGVWRCWSGGEGDWHAGCSNVHQSCSNGQFSTKIDWGRRTGATITEEFWHQLSESVGRYAHIGWRLILRGVCGSRFLTVERSAGISDAGLCIWSGIVTATFTLNTELRTPTFFTAAESMFTHGCTQIQTYKEFRFQIGHPRC